MIFDYFFLKFYNGILKSSIPEHPRFYTSLVFGLFTNFTIFEVSGILSKLDILPFLYHNKTIAWISTPIIVTIVFLIYNKNRIEAIKLKFTKEEFKPKKKKFNIIFVLYIVLTILAAFILPLYKPGYLP